MNPTNCLTHENNVSSLPIPQKRTSRKTNPISAYLKLMPKIDARNKKPRTRCRGWGVEKALFAIIRFRKNLIINSQDNADHHYFVYLSFSFNFRRKVEEELNVTTLRESIVRSAPVWGFLPLRDLFFLTSHFPNPEIRRCSPFSRAVIMILITMLICFWDLGLGIPTASCNLSANFCLVRDIATFQEGQEWITQNIHFQILKQRNLTM
jgi:hypothetical protein